MLPFDLKLTKTYLHFWLSLFLSVHLLLFHLSTTDKFSIHGTQHTLTIICCIRYHAVCIGCWLSFFVCHCIGILIAPADIQHQKSNKWPPAHHQFRQYDATHSHPYRSERRKHQESEQERVADGAKRKRRSDQYHLTIAKSPAIPTNNCNLNDKHVNHLLVKCRIVRFQRYL